MIGMFNYILGLLSHHPFFESSPVFSRLSSMTLWLHIKKNQWFISYLSGNYIVYCFFCVCFFRIYDITEPNSHQQLISMSDNDTQFNTMTSRNRFSVALGDNVVAFDFGPPIELKLKNRRESSSKMPEQAWPVYLLRGSGDICVLYTSLNYKT